MRLSPKKMSARLGEKVDSAAAGPPVPPGSEPAAEEQRSGTSARERGAMRRRGRRLRRSREVLLLELGALVFESERRGRRDQNLVKAKVDRLAAVDEEARALAAALREDRPLVELVAAGVSSACTNCGSLLFTDARFCSSCGTPTSDRERRRAREAAQVQAAQAQAAQAQAAQAQASRRPRRSRRPPSPTQARRRPATGSRPPQAGRQPRRRRLTGRPGRRSPGLHPRPGSRTPPHRPPPLHSPSPGRAPTAPTGVSRPTAPAPELRATGPATRLPTRRLSPPARARARP